MYFMGSSGRKECHQWRWLLHQCCMPSTLQGSCHGMYFKSKTARLHRFCLQTPSIKSYMGEHGHFLKVYEYCGHVVTLEREHCISFVPKPSMLLDEISLSLKFSLMKLWSWVVHIRCSCLENDDLATWISPWFLRSRSCVCEHTLILVVFPL